MTFGVVGSRMRRDEEVYITSDLLSEILKRLPAKKLMQLQCVCKSWKSLISSSAFVSCHNLNTVTTTSCVTSSGGSRLQLTRKCYRDVANVRDMLYGVIFLRYVHVRDRNKSLLCVWNPCIRKDVILPWPVGQVQGHPRTYFRLEGEWFDAATNDFKVVRSQMEGSYDLLSVRNGEWRMNLPFPQSRLIKPGMKLCAGKGRLFNGSIHWIVGPDTRDVYQIAHGHYEFLRFDCEREEFNVMDVPTQLVQGSGRAPLLFLLDLGAGTMLSLAKFVSTGLEGELWLMHPGSSSWARLDRNHPKFAAAATRDVISCSGLTFKPLFHHHGRFQLTTNSMENFTHFKETMMLMDIGKPSSSKLYHRFTHI